MIAVVIVAAGIGSRTGLHYNKLLYDCGNRTVISDTLAAFDGRGFKRILVCNERDFDAMRALSPDDVTFVLGGATRAESVTAGLQACADCEYVLVHDGARPYLSARDLDACVADLYRYGSCVMVSACTDSVRIDGLAVPRERVALMSTPQAFPTQRLLEAYSRADQLERFTDDATAYESLYGAPHLLTLLDPNDKITVYADLVRWSRRASVVGAGFDEHRYADGRKLVLCGVTIDSPFGLLGHSDADAPLHALTDAVLTAVGLRDIGALFPDSDPTTEGADSRIFLKEALRQAKCKGYEPHNVSLVLHAQRPKLSAHIETFRSALSDLLSIPVERVGISATSGEHMGHIGRGEGLACYAVVTMLPCTAQE